MNINTTKNIVSQEDIKKLSYEPMTKFRYIIYNKNIPYFIAKVLEKHDTYIVIEAYDFINPDSYKLIINLLLKGIVELSEIKINQVGPVGDVICKTMFTPARIKILEKPESFDIDTFVKLQIEFN